MSFSILSIFIINSLCLFAKSRNCVNSAAVLIFADKPIFFLNLSANFLFALTILFKRPKYFILFNNSSFFFVQLTLHESSPLIDRFLALEALSSKVRETFVEWNFQHMIVNYPGPSLSKHPEVVAEDVPSKDIDRVMSSTEDRH